MGLWQSILAVGFAVALLYFGIPWLYGRWKRWRLKRLAVRRHSIVLSLDDGPGRRLTPAILDLLAAEGVKATFFLLGRNIAGNEDIVRRIHTQGHEIGSHSYDHLHAWKVSPWRSVSDIRRGFKAIDDTLGVRGGSYVFRPPHGKLNLATWLYLLVKGIPIVYWTKDSGDTWGAKRGQADEVARDVGNTGGGVVLAHDFDRESEELHRYVSDVLKLVLNTAQENGLRVSTVSQLRGVRK